MGDPAGVGPEIIAKVLESGELHPLCRPVVVGDAGVMEKLIEEMHLSVSVRAIAFAFRGRPRERPAGRS